MSDTHARWQAIWARRGWLAHLLWPLSRLYGTLVAQRRRRYLSEPAWVEQMPVPVIVVGNVVVGGAGKTPVVLALLAHLRARGWTPGVVSRGHGRQGHDVLELQPDTPATEGGDEPTLIHQRSGAPTVVGQRRAEAAKALLQTHPEVDVIVCDDGLQHHALGRDIAIVVFDDRGIGNGWLLPAGLLREPWPPATVDRFTPQLLLWHHRSPVAAQPVAPPGVRLYQCERQLAAEACNPQGHRRTLAQWKGQPVVAVAGIARPDVFFDMLREQGLTLARAVALPDHAGPEHYRTLLTDGSITLLCTEKDAVKLFPLALSTAGAPECWSVGLTLLAEPPFFAAIDQLLDALPQRPRLSSSHGHQTA